MKRVCFLLKIKKNRSEDYLEAHQVWPEMRKTIQQSGIRNYSIYGAVF